jgi:hypothetical protein
VVPLAVSCVSSANSFTCANRIQTSPSAMISCHRHSTASATQCLLICLLPQALLCSRCLPPRSLRSRRRIRSCCSHYPWQGALVMVRMTSCDRGRRWAVLRLMVCCCLVLRFLKGQTQRQEVREQMQAATKDVKSLEALLVSQLGVEARSRNHAEVEMQAEVEEKTSLVGDGLRSQSMTLPGQISLALLLAREMIDTSPMPRRSAETSSGTRRSSLCSSLMMVLNPA